MVKKRMDYEYAKICLEAWGFWMLGDHGFSTRSAIARIGEPKNSGNFTASIPKGLVPKNREVEYANSILAMMNNSSGKSAERAHILKVVTRNQQGGESIANVFKRLNISDNVRVYSSALEEFTFRLEVLMYLDTRKVG